MSIYTLSGVVRGVRILESPDRFVVELPGDKLEPFDTYKEAADFIRSGKHAKVVGANRNIKAVGQIVPIKKYKTTDGELFNDYEEAINHQVKINKKGEG